MSSVPSSVPVDDDSVDLLDVTDDELVPSDASSIASSVSSRPTSTVPSLDNPHVHRSVSSASAGKTSVKLSRVASIQALFVKVLYSSYFRHWIALSHNRQKVLRPGEYDVYLVMDVREQTAFHKDKGAIQRKLSERGVSTLIRQLPLGDFLWMAKERVPVRLDQLVPTQG